MEILPLVKTHHLKTSNLRFSVNSNRNPIFITEANSIYRNFFRGLRLVLRSSYGDGGSIAHPGLENMPLSVDLDPLSSETQFDRVISEAQQLEEPVVILWMANWCRKCIYLKPKLEKLAADYYPRVRFYSIDVNNVPHKLVVRAGVTMYPITCGNSDWNSFYFLFFPCLYEKTEQKMPTIQLWRDGKKQAEVIGGQKAYLVVTEVREMIENENGLL